MNLQERIRAEQKKLSGPTRHEKLDNKKSVFRILPNTLHAKDPELPWWQTYGSHFVKDTQGNIKAVSLCRFHTFGEPCPVCQEVFSGKKMVGEETEEFKALSQSGASTRMLYNVIYVSKNGKDSDPVILEVPKSVAEAIFNLIEEYGDPSDPKNGYDITVNATGEGIARKYAVLPAKGNHPLEDLSILDRAENLLDHVKGEWDEGRGQMALMAAQSITGVVSSSGNVLSGNTVASLTDASDDFEPAFEPDEEIDLEAELKNL